MPGLLKMRVKWEATPAQLRTAFARLEAGLRDWSPASVRIREILASMFSGIFGSSGAQLEGTWAPLHPETIRRRMRAGGEVSSATLRLTGALEASLTSDSAPGAIRQVIQPGQGVPRLVWGTSLPQAWPLQSGSKRGLPGRRFVGLTDSAQDDIREVLQELLNRRLEETAAALGGKS